MSYQHEEQTFERDPLLSSSPPKRVGNGFLSKMTSYQQQPTTTTSLGVDQAATYMPPSATTTTTSASDVMMNYAANAGPITSLSTTPTQRAAVTAAQQLTQTKRIINKSTRPRKAIAEFRKKGRHVSGWKGRVGVHVPVDEIDIEKLHTKLSEALTGWSAVDYFDTVRLWQTEPPYIGHELWADWPMSEDEDAAGASEEPLIDLQATIPEVFIFSFGVVVFWNFPSQGVEETWLKEHILKPLPDCYGLELKSDEVEAASDEMAFTFGPKFGLRRDIATLTTKESGEKLAVAFALAKSSLLTVYEERVQKTIERNSHIPEEMAKNGRLHMTRIDISKEIGRMFLVKHGINLDQSLIDTPEEFWEDDRFEATYETTLKYFEISKRLTLVNNRLNMIGELHQVLIEENQNHHAVILEWIIIILIVVEVLLDMLHLGFY